MLQNQGMESGGDHQPAWGHRPPGVADLALHNQHGTVCLMIGKIDRLVALVLNHHMNCAAM